MLRPGFSRGAVASPPHALRTAGQPRGIGTITESGRHPLFRSHPPARLSGQMSDPPRRGGCRRVLLATVALAGSWACLSQATARADVCPNENLRRAQTYAAQLPDCRAYEQVSPVEKNLSDAIGHVGLTQVSPDGERVTYGSIVPFPGVPGASDYVTYLSTRASDGWSTQGLLPGSPGPQGEESAATVLIAGLTEDLSDALLSEGAKGFLYNTGSLGLSEFPYANEGFVDASADDSAILFASSQSLMEGAIEGDPNLYEWDAGRLSLVGADATAGPDLDPERRFRAYTEHAISADGSRVFYTSPASRAGEGRIYMREDLGAPVAISGAPAEWRAATPDGASVFYTENGGLYRWTRHPGEPEAHTTEIAEPGMGVIGVLGVSDDGSYAYFAAGGGTIYEWHEGQPVLSIASLSAAEANESDNWRNYFLSEPLGSAEGLKSSQVTPDGRTLLFTSSIPLTGYPNQGHSEIFLYDAVRGSLVCVSCNPSGEPASSDAFLSHQPIKYATEPSARSRPFAVDNVSEDGRRVFFQTAEALVPRDENELTDVYEWEGGRVYLISSGADGRFGYFGGASADGRDVFFFSRQPLVAQDRDDNIDVYDAREGGGIPAQNEAPPQACVGEQCRGAVAPPPPFGVPASNTFLGAGNLAPQPPLASKTKLARKPKPKRSPKCRRSRKRNRRGRCAAAGTSGRGRR
ncbi:MAG: TolB family protein [Solirubrobacterales bacterium]